jgi:hypothetical protein
VDGDRVVVVGDRVTYAGTPGKIVFVVGEGYSDQYPKEHWSFLGQGFGLELQDGTLIHFDTPDEDLLLAL